MPSSRASACFRKVYSSSISAGTLVFSCIDWSGSGPKSDRSAATIQPDRYRYLPLVVPKCFLIEMSFCWPMKPCQQPSDCV